MRQSLYAYTEITYDSLTPPKAFGDLAKMQVQSDFTDISKAGTFLNWQR
jgi:hypothetical protein